MTSYKPLTTINTHFVNVIGRYLKSLTGMTYTVEFSPSECLFIYICINCPACNLEAIQLRN